MEQKIGRLSKTGLRKEELLNVVEPMASAVTLDASLRTAKI